MEKFKIVFKWYPVVIIICGIAVVYAKTVETAAGNSMSAIKARPDIISIDAIKVFGDLERPSVLFLHDKHTDAVEKSGGDCSTCHISENDRMSQKFMGWDEQDQRAAMDNFHINCIGCHEETSAKNQASGPVTCADCHQKEPTVSSSRQAAGLDNSLHYRHSKAYDKKCETCHTDCKTDTYKKGEETTCRHCHHNENSENQSEDKIVSLKNAVHESCMTCHRTNRTEKKETGPVKCAGCHGLEAQKSVKKVFPVPRMERQQPDILMLKTGDTELDQPGKNRMEFVAFNHKAHENYNDTCRVCHHESMSACNTCHTVEGSDKSRGVTLEQAMHKMDMNQSCIGCHETKKHDTACAGCHGFLSKNREQTDESCLMCHAKLPEGAGVDEAAARAVIEQRPVQSTTYDAEDIPERIVIRELSDQYEPVDFPHRQIVNKIVMNIKDNKLAAYFHAEKGTLCQGCHHHSPATRRPTGCKNCHGKPFNEKDMNKPSIMGAYHIQCMACHTNMKIANNGCTDCHQEKK